MTKRHIINSFWNKTFSYCLIQILLLFSYLLKELRDCILCIICVWSLFCSVRVYISLHFLPIFFGKTRFSSFCVLDFRVSVSLVFSVWFFCLVLEAVAQRCSVKKVFLGILQNSQENTCVRVNFIKKETLAQVSSCEFCKIYKNTFFHRTLPMAASVVFLFEFNVISKPSKNDELLFRNIFET